MCCNITDGQHKVCVTYLETSTKFGLFLEEHKKLLLLAVMNSEAVVQA